MDVPPDWSWEKLQTVADDRVAWRGRVKSLRDGPAPIQQVTGSLATRRSERIVKATTTTTPTPPSRCASFAKTTTTTPTLPSPMARKYIARDAHEMFFRPGLKGKRKRSTRQPAPRKKKKSPALTNRQRAARARAYYEEHHGNNGDTPSPSPAWSPPAILGHHQSNPPSNSNTTMARLAARTR